MYNLQDVWQGLFPSGEAAKKYVNDLRRGGSGFAGSETMTFADYSKLLKSLAMGLRVTPNVKNEAAARLRGFGIKLQLFTPPEQRAELWHERWARNANDFLTTISEFFASHPVTLITLLCVLGIQVKHVAGVAHYVAPSDGWVVPYVFGIASEITALLATIHATKYNKNRIGFFAFLQFVMNMLYYATQGEADILTWVIRVVFSGFIAFVIFSYSDIFTKFTR